MATASMGAYTPATPGAFVLIDTSTAGAAAVSQYADLAALQTAVAGMS